MKNYLHFIKFSYYAGGIEFPIVFALLGIEILSVILSNYVTGAAIIILGTVVPLLMMACMIPIAVVVRKRYKECNKYRTSDSFVARKTLTGRKVVSMKVSEDLTLCPLMTVKNEILSLGNGKYICATHETVISQLQKSKYVKNIQVTKKPIGYINLTKIRKQYEKCNACINCKYNKSCDVFKKTKKRDAYGVTFEVKL